MTPEIFISLFTFGSLIVGLLTEAIKTWYRNAGKKPSSNIIALIDAVGVGGLWTAAMYKLNDIPFTTNNIIYLCSMVFFVWVGAMIGYDKIIQTLTQITSKEMK